MPLPSLSRLAPLLGTHVRSAVFGAALADPADGLDPRPETARALGDLVVLRLDDAARRLVAFQAAQRRARHPAVGGQRAVLIKDVEQHELGLRRGFLSRHVSLLFTRAERQGASGDAAGDARYGDARRESSLSLAMRSNVSPLLLTRYWNSPASAGSCRTTSYCRPEVGTPGREGAKSTSCPTLNLWCAIAVSVRWRL